MLPAFNKPTFKVRFRIRERVRGLRSYAPTLFGFVLYEMVGRNPSCGRIIERLFGVGRRVVVLSNNRSLLMGVGKRGVSCLSEIKKLLES